MTTKRLVTKKSELELQAKVFWVVKKLQKGGYIKGYGNKDRLMSGDHSPIENIETKVRKCLIFNKLLEKDGLIFKPTDKINTIKNGDEIEIEEIL